MTDDARQQRKTALCRCAIARTDITQALRLTEFMVDRIRDLSDPLYQPLFHAIVASYARPFTGNRPLGRLESEWAEFQTEDQKGLHQQLLDLRHKYVAHSDMTTPRVEAYPPGAQAPVSGSVITRPSVCVENALLDLSVFPAIGRLCLHVGTRLDRAVDSLLDELYEGRELPDRPFYVVPEDDL